jgi:TusA-related sulfurtransferase
LAFILLCLIHFIPAVKGTQPSAVGPNKRPANHYFSPGWHRALCRTPGLQADIFQAPVENKPKYYLDFRNTLTPFRLLELTRIFREMQAADIIEIISHDGDTRLDLLRVLPAGTYRLILMEHAEDAENMEIHRIHLQKCNVNDRKKGM